jgi:hypothetical protein
LSSGKFNLKLNFNTVFYTTIVLAHLPVLKKLKPMADLIKSAEPTIIYMKMTGITVYLDIKYAKGKLIRLAKMLSKMKVTIV